MDPEVWGVHFPPGYRERLAPAFLADVYSQGPPAQEWARAWLRERELLECVEARELIAIGQALDSMLAEKLPDLINSVGTERLCRKALGLMAVYRLVKKKADWEDSEADACGGEVAHTMP